MTICTHERGFLLGEIRDGEEKLDEVGEIVLNIWNRLPERFPNIKLDESVVMPNHFHGMIWILHDVGTPLVGAPVPAPQAGTGLPGAGASPAPTISGIIGAFKSITTVDYIRFQSKKNSNQVLPKLWQRSFYDRIIRNEKELFAIRNYIRNNPRNWERDEYSKRCELGN